MVVASRVSAARIGVIFMVVCPWACCFVEGHDSKSRGGWSVWCAGWFADVGWGV